MLRASGKFRKCPASKNVKNKRNKQKAAFSKFTIKMDNVGVKQLNKHQLHNHNLRSDIVTLLPTGGKPVIVTDNFNQSQSPVWSSQVSSRGLRTQQLSCDFNHLY